MGMKPANRKPKNIMNSSEIHEQITLKGEAVHFQRHSKKSLRQFIKHFP